MDPTALFDKLSALSTQLLDSAAEYSKMDIPIDHDINSLIATLRQSFTILENIEHKDPVNADIGVDDADEDDDGDDCDPEIVGICDMLMNIKYGKQDELATFDSEYDKVWGRIDAARASRNS
jgi:hypothetical protein